MRIRLSHRWRIALAAGGVAALLFAVVLGATYERMVRMERHAAAELLDAPLGQIANAIKTGEPLNDEISTDEDVSVAVFSSDGSKTFQTGAAPLSLTKGDGDMNLGGRSLIYETQTHGNLTVMAASDWTRSRNRLMSLRTTFIILLIPLSLIVGLAAYIAAGLMYKPLRTLTLAARAMATAGKVGLLDDPDDAEFSPLVRELNELLSRISVEVERQERLVSDVAHDLSTPLTVIRGRLETALMRNNPDEFRPAIKTVIRETERLSAMAETILQSERLPLSIEPLALLGPTREAIERWTSTFERRGATLSDSISECRVNITEEEWTSLLDNLLDNAFKYGGDNCRVILTNDSTAVLEVIDNGSGIDSAEHERVFERFTRLDSSRASNGHGLGLYLCRRIVLARGGSIGIEGDNSGMRIVAKLPLAELNS